MFYKFVKAPMWLHIFNTDKSSETYQVFFYKEKQHQTDLFY